MNVEQIASGAIVGAALIILVMLAVGVGVGARIGREFGQKTARRQLQSAETLNMIMSASSEILQHDRQEVLELILERALTGLEATAGSIHFAAGGGQPLRLLHARGVRDFARFSRIGASDPLVDRMAGGDDVLVLPQPADTSWSVLLESGGRVVATAFFGRRDNWHGVLALAWHDRARADEAVPTLYGISHYARQVLAELETLAKRARAVAIARLFDDSEPLA